MSNKDRYQMLFDFSSFLSNKMGLDARAVEGIQDKVLADLGITSADLVKVKEQPSELEKIIGLAFSEVLVEIKKSQNQHVKNSIGVILDRVYASTRTFNTTVDSLMTEYNDNPKLAIKNLANESAKLQKTVESALNEVAQYNSDPEVKRAVRHFMKTTKEAKKAFDEQVQDLQSFERLTKMAVRQRAYQLVNTMVSVTLFAVSIPLGVFSIIPSFFAVGFAFLAYGAIKDKYASKEEARFNLGKVFGKDTSRYTSDKDNIEYKSTWSTWQQMPLPKSVKNVISNLALGISSLCVCMKKRTDDTNEVTNRNPTSPRSRRA